MRGGVEATVGVLVSPRVAILSPHLDDAVLSSFALIASQPAEVLVITVLAGGPQNLHRRQEDRDASRVARFKVCHLEEDSLETATALESARIAISEQLDRHRIECLVVPAGIGHPDHLSVSRVGLSFVRRLGSLVVYEDIPYRVMCRTARAERMQRLRECFEIERVTLPSYVRQHKEDAVSCYRSQLDEFVNSRVARNVPESLWRISSRR